MSSSVAPGWPSLICSDGDLITHTRRIKVVREDELMRRTGVIQSERQVFEMAREYFGLDKPEGVA
jgi:hypothetical protein